MEQQTGTLTSLIGMSAASNIPNCSNSRLAQYKARSNVPNQEERRRRLLEEQKQKRSELFDASRGLVEELNALHEDHGMEWTAVQARPRQRRICKDRLMLSEWLVHVPEDLSELWYLVPCPKGRRVMVVATGGNTRAYSRSGQWLAAFQSILPGGHHNESKACTILDCVWSFTNHSYYILDVLAWNNQPLLDCEAEFRFFWLKSKVQEMPSLSERSHDNAFVFTSLAYHQCSVSTMTSIMASENLFGQDGPALDGLLFYHSEAHYVPGRTPLVGWLKPHMMATVLSVPVPSVYLHTEQKNHRKFHKRQRKSQVWQAVVSDVAPLNGCTAGIQLKLNNAPIAGFSGDGSEPHEQCNSSPNYLPEMSPPCDTPLLQQDETGCSDSAAEMETNVSGETEDSCSELRVEDMESSNSEQPKDGMCNRPGSSC